MKAARSSIAISVGAAAAVLCATTAFASGYMPMPEWREVLANHKACVAQLEARSSEQRKQVKPRTFNADSGFQEIYLEDRSDGVKVINRKTARYEARIWYHNGRLLEDGKQYEISHSWDETNQECRGKVLIVTNSQGYTLSTFEPVPPKGP
jgi:hypothetical protein